VRLVGSLPAELRVSVDSNLGQNRLQRKSLELLYFSSALLYNGERRTGEGMQSIVRLAVMANIGGHAATPSTQLTTKIMKDWKEKNEPQRHQRHQDRNWGFGDVEFGD
jgi:hypothetical protein